MDFSAIDEWVKAVEERYSITGLKVRLSVEWGSTHSTGRQQLEQALILEKTSTSSISHTRDLGGFAVMESKGTMGFDVEQRERITPQVVRRISNAEEFSQAPQRQWLWVAKEAAFKSLRGPMQPQLLSSIRINKWKPLSTTLHSADFAFSAGTMTGYGSALSTDRYAFTLAFFVDSPY